MYCTCEGISADKTDRFVAKTQLGGACIVIGAAHRPIEVKKWVVNALLGILQRAQRAKPSSDGIAKCNLV
jgi:hypothetical protein